MEARFILPPQFYVVITDRALAVVSVNTSFGQTGVSVTNVGGVNWYACLAKYRDRDAFQICSDVLF